MKRFEFVDITTADTAFVAYGKDLNINGKSYFRRSFIHWFKYGTYGSK